MLGQYVQQILEFRPRLVQRHLDERWLRTVDLVELGEQLVERFRAFVERFARHRVRAGDVHFDHGGAAGRAAHRNAVILDAFVQISGLAVVRAGDGHRNLHALGLRPRVLGTRNHHRGTFVGQADVHHHRIVFRQTMEPRTGIAGAWTGGGGTDRLEAEADVVEQHRHLAILVEAGGQAERVGEVDAHNAGLQHRVGVVEHLAAQPHQRRNVACDLAEFDHLAVRHVGRVVEDEMRLDDVLVAEGEEVGGGFVHGVVPKVFGNVCHGSLFSHVFVGFARRTWGCFDWMAWHVRFCVVCAEFQAIATWVCAKNRRNAQLGFIFE